ncbi:MAG TPA: hypothetical protein VGD79_13360 [Thermoanaerobaculia bacterium]|jgi:hypothetical protein
MTRLRVTTIGILSLLLLLSAAPRPQQPQPTAADWTFSGCFSLTGSTPCYDVYTHNGGYWICSQCGTTKRPSESKCRQLSQYELTNGRWCS